MDSTPPAPGPQDSGDPRPGDRSPDEEWSLEEEGPFFAWLPPEDRLWRHPSEGAPVRAVSRAGSGDRRWTGILPLSAVRSTWAIALIAGLVGAAATTGVGLATGLWPQHTTVIRSYVPSTSAVSLADVGSEPVNWTAIDDSVAPSVVTILVYGAAGPQNGSGLVLQSAAGRAFVVTDLSLFSRDQAAGYIGAVEVTFLSGAEAKAKVVGEDQLSGLALLEISGAAAAVPAQLGTVAGLREAEPVLAVGSRTAPSVFPGSVSAEDRTVSLADGTDMDGLLAISMPQLASTAAGGPLLDQFGQVVGLTLQLNPLDPTDQQFTYAVPIDVVNRIATEMINGVAPTHPWLGIADAENVPSTIAHQLGLDGGVQVGAVSPQSPAGEVGMRADDVIVSLGGKSVVSTGALLAQVNSTVPGRTMAMTYVHSGRTIRAMIRVGDEPPDG